MFTKQNEDKILSWIETENMDQLGKYLLSGTIHGKPGVPVAELGRIEKLAKKILSQEEQYQFAKRLLKRSEYTARNIGTHLVASGWPNHKDVEIYIKKAADDDDWIVREYAAGTFATLLEKDFSHFSKLYLKWLKTESVNVKRAVALAVKYESKSAESKKWKTYFNLIDPLMAEEAEYIRKNLGPFAIGDGLLSRYPDQIFASCKKWIKSDNENVRWNTAMIFTAAAARKFAKEGKVILQTLEKDANPFVSRAAKKATKNLLSGVKAK
jgi:HEAT repeat protein